MLSVLRRLSVVLTRFMGVIIIAFSALALWQPWIFSWVAPHISAMLGIIMLGMMNHASWQTQGGKSSRSSGRGNRQNPRPGAWAKGRRSRIPDAGHVPVAAARA